jgi:hypothetical protein
MNFFALFVLSLVLWPALPQNPAAQNHNVQVSLVVDAHLGPAASHGLDKIRAALAAKRVVYEEVAKPEAARGATLLIAGLPSDTSAAANVLGSIKATVPTVPESLLIRTTSFHAKQAIIVSGSDDRGLMYGLLEVADRIGWTKGNAVPFSKVRNVTESPSVADRGVTIFTMQQRQFEDRLHDENYLAKYFDTLAKDRFNNVQLLFAYETNGYMCPVYPYFIDVDGFPGLKAVGLSAEQQQKNRADLHRFIRMAHDRGIRVTLGIWCHYFRFSQTWTPVDHSKPIPGTVSGLNDDNLVPYTRAALGQFLREYKEIDGAQLLMHNESGLKTGDMKEFWKSIYRVMKAAAPDIQYELRAKGISDDLVAYGQSLGLKIQVNTKYWSEQVGLPFHPTHIQELNQFERRHGYSDMLRYPRNYQLHWTLWTSGTTRILLWGDPNYVRRFAPTTHLGGVQGFEVMEPLATKMAGHPQDLKPFDLLAPQYKYYEYEFERYWRFFQVFGRLSYNPDTPEDDLDHEFITRFGAATGPRVAKGLQRASEILPQITAYCLPADHFPTTRGWPERQRQGDLPEYVKAAPSDTEQFESIEDAADDIYLGRSSSKRTPMETSRWFAQAATDVRRFVAQAQSTAGANPGKEFTSTMVDLKILSDLADYHAHRIPAGLRYALFERTQDLNALDDAISYEKQATEAWARIVRDAGDVYNYDLMMGLPEFDLSGHWRDELLKLKAGVSALEKRRSEFHPEAARVVGRYFLPAGTPPDGYQRLSRGSNTLFETNGSNLVTLDVPPGRYQVKVDIHDDKASHGPMWIEVNGVEYSDVFTVPAGQQVERILETSAVNGKLKILFDNTTSADWYASTLVVTRIDPLISSVPIRRLKPGQPLNLRATVTGITSISHVRVHYGDPQRGYAVADLQGTSPEYHIEIPSSRLTGNTSYFLEAVDTQGRTSISPEQGRTNPIAVTVTGDDQPPSFHHTPVLSTDAHTPIHITATLSDPSGVKWVHLRYRGLSQHQDYQTLEMLPTGNPDEYEATVPAEDVDPHFDFMYFFEVMDNVSNGKIYPDMDKETPYFVVKMSQPAKN